MRDCVKLTAYFGERQRSGGRFLAEAMLDLHEQRGVAVSAVLRGIGGFGSRHRLRSDQSLSLSEDPPVAVVAVDAQATVEAMLDPLRVMSERALMTLERVRLVDAAIASSELDEHLHEAVKLTVYLGRTERINGTPGYRALCDLLHRSGFDGASAFLGVDGVIHGRRERARFFGPNSDVPVMIVAVGGAALVSAVLPELVGSLRRPLVSIERVQVCKRAGVLVGPPRAVVGTDEHGLALWQKLTVHSSEADRHRGVPIHRALIERLRQHRSLAGATVLRGIYGFNGGAAPRGDRLLALSRRVPVATVIIGSPRHVGETFAVVDELTSDAALVTSEVVPALVVVHGDQRHGGMRLARYR